MARRRARALARARRFARSATWRSRCCATAATARFRTLDALPLYEELIVTGAWWDFVDEVAAGPLGELLPEVAPALRAWSVDEDMWKRRAAIIAQVRRKRETDFALLTDCIEPNRGDREFFIRKAIGWALRAYAWVEPEAVIAYCDTHELTRCRAARRSRTSHERRDHAAADGRLPARARRRRLGRLHRGAAPPPPPPRSDAIGPSRSSVSSWKRFQPPGSGTRPSGIACRPLPDRRVCSGAGGARRGRASRTPVPAASPPSKPSRSR